MTETNRTRVDEFTEPKKYTDKLTGLIFSIYIVSLPILWNICHSLLLGKELLIVCTLLFCSILYAGTAISKSTGFSKQKFINISYADISIVLFSFILTPIIFDLPATASSNPAHSGSSKNVFAWIKISLG